jgi:hypothetical protein
MILIISGSRGFTNYALLKERVDNEIKRRELTDVSIMSGCAPGADRLGERYARERGYPLLLRPADWKNNGPQAGFYRNASMAREADMLIAFWDSLSRDTSHMIRTMRAEGKRTVVVEYLRESPGGWMAG